MHSKAIFVTKGGQGHWAYLGSANLSESAWSVPTALESLARDDDIPEAHRAQLRLTDILRAQGPFE